MTYGNIRVSAEAQNTENQKMEIEQFCKRRNISIDKWVEDVISGTKDPYSRNLGKLIMENCVEGDTIICTELSRLGRSLLMVMNTLNYFLTNKVSVITIKDNFNLSDDITSKVISFAFGLSAEIERQLISQRTKAALERARKEGKHIGRKKGRKSSSYKLDKFNEIIAEEFLKGKSKNAIARQLGVNWHTVNTQIKRIGL